MNSPSRVLISGGREAGGVTAFANNLAEGFRSLGIPVEVIPPHALLRRWRDLRDPRVLKILSTTAVFAVPFARQAICVAHGFPRADVQGWTRFFAILASYYLANLSGAPLVAVSAYVATHLGSLFALRVDAVVHNAMAGEFFAPPCAPPPERNWVSFVGRLHPVKNLQRLLPALRELLDSRPDLKVCIIGDGPLRPALEAQVRGDARFEFRGQQDSMTIREQLRRSRVFISGCETEAFGISYLEALSQGCNVVMPAAGGGLEIAPQWIGSHIQLMPLSFDRAEIVAKLERSVALDGPTTALEAYRPEQIAAAYLRLFRT
jgi:glycosyltransferase involved in cell wall biosynthesis